MTTDQENLISTIEQLDFLLAESYSLWAGTGEGCTIKEHTEGVLASAKRFQLYDSIPAKAKITHAEFRLFLALHDVGKGFAVKEHPSADATRKELELRYNSSIIQKVMQATGVSQEKIDIFLAMQKHDTLGMYFKEEQDLSTTRQQLREMAQEANLPYSVFLELFRIYHMADASSYLFLLTRIFRAEGSSLSYSERNEKMLEELRQRGDSC